MFHVASFMPRSQFTGFIDWLRHTTDLMGLGVVAPSIPLTACWDCAAVTASVEPPELWRCGSCGGHSRLQIEAPAPQPASRVHEAYVGDFPSRCPAVVRWVVGFLHGLPRDFVSLLVVQLRL